MGVAYLVGRLTAGTADGLALDICSGLAAVHGVGVVHRDLKLANVMVDGRGRGRLTDFGLAVEVAAALPSARGAIAMMPSAPFDPS